MKDYSFLIVIPHTLRPVLSAAVADSVHTTRTAFLRSRFSELLESDDEWPDDVTPKMWANGLFPRPFLFKPGDKLGDALVERHDRDRVPISRILRRMLFAAIGDSPEKGLGWMTLSEKRAAGLAK